MHKLDTELRSVVTDIFVNVGGSSDVSLCIGAIRPVNAFWYGIGVLVSDRVPQLVSCRLEGMPSKPPVVLSASN